MRRRAHSAYVPACIALAVLFAGPGARSAQAVCPNEQLRAESSSLGLPDCRAYEMVSPVDKNGGAIGGFGASSGGGVLQAAEDGGTVTYSSASSFGEAAGAPAASQYLGRRSGAGWSSENIAVASLSGSYGDDPDGVPYQLFSADLARGLLLNGLRCRGEGEECPVANPPLPGSGAPPGFQNYYLRDDGAGGFQALLTDANGAALTLSPEHFEIDFAGASPDLRHIVLSTCAALTPEASEVPMGAGCDPADPNLYLWSEGTLTLISAASGEDPPPFARLGAPAGAISSDGRRVYWNDLKSGDLELYEAGQPTKPVDGLAGGGGIFQTASVDGSVAFYLEGESLYRYEVPAGAGALVAEGVRGVLGASADGSHLYYETSAGLFLSHAGATTKVAAAAGPGNYPPATGTARVTPDGSHLAFLSTASLTGYENAGISEVYLYSAPPAGGAGTLVCASCGALHHPPLGPSTIPGAIANGKAPSATHSYKPRALSTDGARLFFNSRDSLVAIDSNAHQDVYQWEANGAGSCRKVAGCISLLSGGLVAEDSELIDANLSGSDVFFLSGASFLPQDPGSYDLYDAHENGGYPQPPTQLPCDGDTCQALPYSPEDPVLGTSTPDPSGNPTVHFPKAHGKKPHRKRHHKGKKGSRKAAAKHNRGGSR